jgi:O-antigen ligase
MKYRNPSIARIPWLTIAFLSVVFIFSNFDWDYTTTIGDLGAPSDRADLIGEGNKPRRFLYSLLGGVSLLIILFGRRSKMQVNGAFGTLLITLFALTYLSIVWTPEPAFTARRLVIFSIFCLAALAINSRFSLRDIGLLIFTFCWIYLLIGISAEITHGTFLPFSDFYRFAGIQNSNSQGVNCSLLVLSGVFLGQVFKEKKWLFVSLTTVGFLFLILTRSRTSFAAVSLAILAYKGIQSDVWKRIRVIFVLSFLILVALIVLGESAESVAESGVNLGKRGEGVATLQGRVDVWKESFRYTEGRRLFGFGYSGFWSRENIVDISETLDWTLASAHSIYVDYFLQFGFVGWTMYILVLVFSLNRSKNLYRSSKNMGFAYLFAFIVFYCAHGFLESMFLGAGFFAFISIIVFTRLGFFPIDGSSAVTTD